MKRPENNKMKIVYMVFILMVVFILVGMIAVNMILNARLNDKSRKRGHNESYQYHVAMIGKDPSEVFWQSVYEGAKKEGMNRDVFVENFGADLAKEYTAEERMKMSIAAGVDGIIVETEKNEEMSVLIQEADNAGIPVILMGSDVPGSSRKSFVSPNDYTMGELYGQEVIDAASRTNGKSKVAILVRQAGESNVPNLIYSGINETVAADDMETELQPVIVQGSGDFESEETIRNLLLNQSERPDVMVCLNVSDTISAYQCVRDYNLIGEVTIIGFYTSPEILEGIEKGTIKSTIIINAEEMGRMSARAMQEYLVEEYVSEYIQVPSELVTKDTVYQYKNAESGE